MLNQYGESLKDSWRWEWEERGEKMVRCKSIWRQPQCEPPNTFQRILIQTTSESVARIKNSTWADPPNPAYQRRGWPTNGPQPKKLRVPLSDVDSLGILQDAIGGARMVWCRLLLDFYVAREPWWPVVGRTRTHRRPSRTSSSSWTCWAAGSRAKAMQGEFYRQKQIKRTWVRHLSELLDPLTLVVLFWFFSSRVGWLSPLTDWDTTCRDKNLTWTHARVGFWLNSPLQIACWDAMMEMESPLFYPLHWLSLWSAFAAENLDGYAKVQSWGGENLDGHIGGWHEMHESTNERTGESHPVYPARLRRSILRHNLNIRHFVWWGLASFTLGPRCLLSWRIIPLYVCVGGTYL